MEIIYVFWKWILYWLCWLHVPFSTLCFALSPSGFLWQTEVLNSNSIWIVRNSGYVTCFCLLMVTKIFSCFLLFLHWGPVFLVYDWGKSQENFFPHGPPIYVYLLKHCLFPTSLQCHHCYMSSIHIYVWDSLFCPCSIFVILSPITRWFK